MDFVNHIVVDLVYEVFLNQIDNFGCWHQEELGADFLDASFDWAFGGCGFYSFWHGVVLVEILAVGHRPGIFVQVGDF